MATEKMYTQVEMEAHVAEAIKQAEAHMKKEQKAEAKEEAKEANAGFLSGFNWKHNALVGTLTAAAAAGAMYYFGTDCVCDVPNEQ